MVATAPQCCGNGGSGVGAGDTGDGGDGGGGAGGADRIAMPCGNNLAWCYMSPYLYTCREFSSAFRVPPFTLPVRYVDGLTHMYKIMNL